jgi:hypothetical protein
VGNIKPFLEKHMSCIKINEVWKNTIGNDHMFVVETISEDGWINGKRVRLDEEGFLKVVPGTGFIAHHDNMKLTMEKTDLAIVEKPPNKKK